MKKTLGLLAVLFILSGAHATTSVVSPPMNAYDIFLPIGKTGKMISYYDLSRIRVKDFEAMSGKKMRFFDRLAFKAAQKNVRNSINADGTINNKKVGRFLKKSDEDSGSSIGGFALGFFMGPIGILIAYLIKDDKKRNRIKWSWIGWGAWLVIFLVLVIAGVRFD